MKFKSLFCHSFLRFSYTKRIIEDDILKWEEKSYISLLIKKSSLLLNVEIFNYTFYNVTCNLILKRFLYMDHVLTKSVRNNIIIDIVVCDFMKIRL